MNILVIEDERNLADAVCHILQDAGFHAEAVYDGRAGLAYAESGMYDALVLDVMLPGMDGFELVHTLRKASSSVPVLMLTARTDTLDKVEGLNAGADDYMTKPFSMRELMARVKAKIRRRNFSYGASAGAGSLITAGSLTVNPVTFTVTKNGSPVELTQKEYDLLHHLITARGVVFSREELMQKVWNYAYFGDMRTVDVTIRRLREKIEDDPGKPTLIMTKRGVGYYFAE